MKFSTFQKIGIPFNLLTLPLIIVGTVLGAATMAIIKGFLIGWAFWVPQAEAERICSRKFDPEKSPLPVTKEGTTAHV